MLPGSFLFPDVKRVRCFPGFHVHQVLGLSGPYGAGLFSTGYFKLIHGYCDIPCRDIQGSVHAVTPRLCPCRDSQTLSMS